MPYRATYGVWKFVSGRQQAVDRVKMRPWILRTLGAG